MILDAQNRLSNAQAFTATANTTDWINVSTIRSYGQGEPLVALIVPTVAADTANGDETYAFALQIDDNTSFSSATTIITKTISRTLLTAGSIHTLDIPIETLPATGEIYLGGRATLGGTTPSVTVDWVIVPRSFVAKYEDYPAGYTVS